MISALTQNWWMVVLRGVFAIIFGVIALARPDITLSALILLFGIYAVGDGIVALAFALVRNEPTGTRWLLALAGLASLGAGVVTFAYPSITATALLALVAAWALVSGIFEIAAAFSSKERPAPAWLLVVGGALSILLSVLLVAYPSDGILSLVWVLGAYGLVYGMGLIVFGFMMADIHHQVGKSDLGRSTHTA